MNVKNELQAKIVALKEKAKSQIAAIQAKTDAEVAELQAVLDTNEGWLLRETDAFQAKVNRIVALIRKE